MRPFTLAFAATAVALAACSQPSPAQCFSDADCANGFTCADGSCAPGSGSGGAGAGASNSGTCAPSAVMPPEEESHCTPMDPSGQSIDCGPCCCSKDDTCTGYVKSGLLSGCPFCVPTNAPRYAQFCGLGAENTPNYCPSGTECIRQTAAPDSVYAYGCCPGGSSCSGVEGFGSCAKSP